MKQEIKDKIFELKEMGLSTYQISEQLKIPQTTVSYWTSDREKTINRVKKKYKSLSKEEKRRIYEKNYPYLKNYLRERYKNDPIFREKQIERVKRYKEKCKKLKV